MLVAGHSADRAKATAPTYGAFASARDRAARDGTIGLVGVIGGLALVGAGISWYVTHRHRATPVLTAWGDSTTGGVSVVGRF